MADLARKMQLESVIQELCTGIGVVVEFLEPRRRTDIFILTLRGDRERVQETHVRLADRLNSESEDIETLAEREHDRNFVLNLVVMEKPEVQTPHGLERRSRMQHFYRT